MPNTVSLAGLYAITPADLTKPEHLSLLVGRALQGGARLIQYRDKSGDSAQRLACARQLRTLTRKHQAILLINDDVDLALATEADGVHLGRDDTDLALARQKLGDHAIIGVSCYNEMELARQAAERGADYVAFGRFFPSRTKPDAVQADPRLLTEARQALNIPVVAIGGITADNGTALIEAGADMLAVIDALFGAKDIEAEARRLSSLFAVT